MKALRKLAIVAAGLVVAALVGWWLLPEPPPLFAEATFSRQVRDVHGRLLRVTLTADQKYRIRANLDKISPDLVTATLCYEDQHFWQHPGINPIAVSRSTWHFVRTHTAYGGASTISMQLARLRYHMNSRTLSGKLWQMVRALEIERHYTKAQILEAYLNFAPYGRNIEGVGAASLLYFGKTPSELSLHEAVALSVIPQSPRRRTPKAGETNDALAAAERRLLVRLHAQETDAESFSPRIEVKRPFAAPHFANLVLNELPARSEIVTTLDLDLQHMLERRITAYLEANRRLGLTNAVAMLVDCHNMEVVAQVGSADFFNQRIEGQVDGTRMRRSPGSTLKPFIYALALDQGVIQPSSILKDAPHRFGGYTPENFDGEFAGPITATDALVRSRNVPAVWLASQLSHPSLYQLLKRGGVRLPHEESYYGLALPLGGGEVTMEELVHLYTALANGGRLHPLHRIQQSTGASEHNASFRLFSPEAAYLTLDMLAHNPRPGLNEGTGCEGISWKTGTSHGFHDAWSVAVFDHYVLAVWLGNFDGRRNAALIGRSCAAPLLFQMIDAMRASGRTRIAPRDPPPGVNLREVELCAVSGQIPTAACKHRVKGWFIPGISPIAPCEIHREVLVDVQTGLRVSVDDGTRELRKEVFEFWPSDLLALFDKAGLPRRRPPPFLPDSTGSIEMAARGGKAPQILSPGNRQRYAIASDGDGHGAIALEALTDADVGRLYWFANQSFLGASSGGAVLSWNPAPGSYRVVALDDHGRSASCVAVIERADTIGAP